ncbi:MAG: amidohydrolase [Bacteroidales bacterium]|nr:amidohydrolase [Bacteroidales bacterium]
MQSSNLILSLIQTDIIWENKNQNLSLLENKIASIEGQSNVIILPEMFSTGFTMNTRLAEPMEGSAVKWMKEISAKYSISLVGSLLIEEEANFYNRLLWVQPNGSLFTYDKRHLFSLGGEDEFFSKGTKKLIIEYDHWKICPMICYDLRFPVWIRNKEEYDVLIFVANWPHTRQNAWRNLLISRAIENQCFCLGVNRVGTDGNGLKYIGGSVVIDPMGEIVKEIPGQEEDIIMIELDKDRILNSRAKLPFLKDADDFLILD